MTPTNAEVVQAGFDAWNAGDMDAYRALLHPDVVWRVPPDWPEQAPSVGRDDVMATIQRGRDAWDVDIADPGEEVVEAGDRVMRSFVWRVSGHGPPTEAPMTCIYTIRDAMVIEFEFFRDHAKARAAMGLPPFDAFRSA